MNGAANKAVILSANTSWYLWNFRRELAGAIRALGYDVVFVAPADAYSARLAECGTFEPIVLSRKGKNPASELLAVWRYAGIFRKHRPAAVMTWTPKPNIYSGLAGRLTGNTVIPNVAGLGTLFVQRGWLSGFVGAMYRAAFSKLKTVFFQNSDDRDDFVSAGWASAAAARLLPGSGVDLERFPATPLPDNDTFVFLYAGRLLAEKGLPELVAAGQRLRDDGSRFAIRVYGHFDPGNPAAITETTMRRWHEQGDVDFRGATDSIETAIREANCVVLPSYYREGVPRILLEAAASGRPVITTDAVGCRDAVIDGVTGLTCKPQDIDSLEAAMHSMLDMPTNERAAMGEAGRRLAEERFDERFVIAAYVDALESLEQRRAG